MDALYNPLTELESFKRLADAVKNNKTPVLTTGVLDSQKIHLLWALCKSLGKRALIVCASELEAKDVSEDLTFFFKTGVMYFPSKDVIFYNADIKSQDTMIDRLNCLNCLLSGEASAVAASVEALFDRLTEKEIYKAGIFEIGTGDELTLEALAERLLNLRYRRCQSNEVTGAGQFMIRGGIMDICVPSPSGESSSGETAYRVEFWGDTVDSIRLFDISTQRSAANIDKAAVYPANELVYNEETRLRGKKNLSAAYEKHYAKLTKSDMNEEADNLSQSVGEDLRLLSENAYVSGLDRYAYFFGGGATLLDYLPENTVIFLNEPGRLRGRSKTVFTEFTQSIEHRVTKGFMLPEQMKMLKSYDDFLHGASKFPLVLFSSVTQNIQDLKLRDNISFTVKPSGAVKGSLSLLYDDIRYLQSAGHAVLFLSGSGGRGARFAGELVSQGINAVFVRDLSDYKVVPGCVAIAKGSLRRGFSYQHINFTVISDAEVFKAEKKHGAKQPKKNASRLESFLDLSIGDYIVHRSHGIGVYRGIEKISADGVSKDYMKLSYSDGGTLYVPANSMDAVQKYVGGDSSAPPLNRLGGSEWGKAKQKARNQVKILAADLIGLYAKRQASVGHAFSQDTVWQSEFEEGFPFEETRDQLQSIEEVKADMENRKVMDRLLCGDVGYGKTEVAIRAAFKAVQDNKQVAYLVPTTILAQQHYDTFTQRMKDFPVGIELLSRFRSKKSQTESISRLNKGLSDIVIGTHRLLSKDVTFKDLGLVIVDEEQRFGVSQKEKLKRLTENVDVLTLTATPIPRTLHMSLTNLRDMSVLKEPPLERHPIQTYVLEYNTEFIRDAVLRELARGGQVYYLFNRVASIETQANNLAELVPEAVVSYAHGQMNERMLENIMRDFIERRIDVLVCTTIIETGLDISNVNTIIINDADCMGLAQLYQLRGRVGRSNKIAYAYLMYKKDKVLDETAEKRLQTIREFTEFGSGFKIAMRDLEIRGAGNLLGAEQHGHMDSVGYELYCRMLEEAIRELGGDSVKSFETLIELKINAFLPDFYIENEELKLEIYRKIACIETEADLSDITDELLDRFGDIPKSVASLLEAAMLKAYAHDMGINQISHKNSALIISFDKDTDFAGIDLISFLNKHKGKLFYTSGASPYLTYKPDDGEAIAPSWIKSFISGMKTENRA